MKTYIIKIPFVISLICAGLGLIIAGQVRAQTFTTLHNFTATSTNSSGVYTNSDGYYANGLILSSNILYGTAQSGGFSGNGTVFKLNIDGTGFTTLHSFSPTSFVFNNSDGVRPEAGLILAGTTLYGTTVYGGNAGDGYGTVFRVNTDGTGFANLHSFTSGSDGDFPAGELVLSSNTLYGTAGQGGNWGQGTVFAVNTDGTELTTLYSFTTPSIATNFEGGYPQAGLVLSDGVLYGTDWRGGPYGYGSVFKVNTNGTGFATLHSFSTIYSLPPPYTNSLPYPYTNSDGFYPNGLILSGNTLFGTAFDGGSWGLGTVFRVNVDGTGFTNLHTFTANPLNPPDTIYTNSDGAQPSGRLTLSGNTLYGTSEGGGSSGGGTVFAVNSDGTGFTNLYIFNAGGVLNSPILFTNSDGFQPYGGLILFGNTLYGTTWGGGSYGYGTVFSISLPVSQPQLTIIPLGANITLSWPTNFTGFTLQSTTNLASTVWTTNPPALVVINGQYTVTNPISGTQQFFRLSQ